MRYEGSWASRWRRLKNSPSLCRRLRPRPWRLLKAFAEGNLAQEEKGDVESLPYYERAVELDPNFARAQASLGAAYGNLGQVTLAIEHLRKAFDLRNRVSERERYFIEAEYFGDVTGELEKADQSYVQWIQLYANDYIPHGNLGANYATLGQYEKAVPEVREYIRLKPDNVID
jgi:eukaryotic-like serine/threonine-protein kinase